MKARLAVVATHPIQYQAPWFRYLHATGAVDLRVFYLWDPRRSGSFDRGFGHPVEWDVPLLDGYPFEFVPNTSRDPGTHRFRGLINPGLFRAVAGFSPEAVLLLGCHFEATYRLIRACGRAGLPLLFRGDSHRLVRRSSPRGRPGAAWLTFVYRRFAACLHVGEASREYFRIHGVPDDRLFFCPHAVDRDLFRPDAAVEREARAWRRDLGVADGERLVAFVGKLEEKKRPLDLLRAFRRADPANASLVFVGAGPLEAVARELAGDDPRIRFVPFQNQSRMPTTYAAADLVVLPSAGPSETWGLAVQEAMEMGRAVIVSDQVGCAADLVVPARNGLVFPAGDIDGLARALRGALEGPDLGEWGREGRRIVAPFDHERATDGLLAALARAGAAGVARPLARPAPPVHQELA